MESPTGEHKPELLTVLREKLARLARWGVLATALTGILPTELVAQQPTPEETKVAQRMEKLEMAKLRMQVKDRVGEAVSQVLEDPPRWTSDRVPSDPVPVSGFKNRGVVDEIRRVLADAPPSFTRQVASVSYDARVFTMPGVYGMSGNTIVARVNRKDHRIVFSAGSYTPTPILTGEFLAHEVCHFADPMFNVDLAEPDRVRIYASVLDRMNAGDRFHSWYVEHISNPDPQVLTTVKAGEYWAETCGAYLRDDKLLPDADRALVESLISKTDPGYTRIR
ncbi:MAG TPA: hypothetical protein VJ553_03640 [Candidatus Paceibacterota bacterium]|nr:hypothetical protein [Candidatus Paceibacterota bacterium]